MSFHDVKFSRRVKVTRSLEQQGTDFIFTTEGSLMGLAFEQTVTKLSEIELLDRIECCELDDNGCDVKTGLHFQTLMDAYANMPTFFKDGPING